MVDSVGGSAVSSQIAATRASVAAIRDERVQTEAVIKAVDDSARLVAQEQAQDRGRRVDIRT